MNELVETTKALQGKKCFWDGASCEIVGAFYDSSDSETYLLVHVLSNGVLTFALIDRVKLCQK